jgi:nucleoside-diphosphate-sugar epimerase
MTSLEGKRMVIFGCGYIGSEVARQAIGRGVQVAALTRNLAKAQELRAAGVEIIVADLASDVWHDDISGEADYVLNAVSSGGGGLEGYRRSYIDGMQSLVRWAEARERLGTLVYTSSTSVYPQGGGAWVDESASTAGSGELPRVLLEAENLLRERCFGPRGLPHQGAVQRLRSIERCFILRLAGIYGPGRNHLVDQVRSGTVAGRGEHHLNLAHRDDIAAAIWAAWESPPTVEGGVFNVADDGPASKQEIVCWLAEQLDVPTPTFTGAPADGRRAVTPDRIISNSRLKALLGWRPRYPTFREGYKNMLALGSE